MIENQTKAKYSWEEAIEILRNNPEHAQLVYDAYLTRDLVQNCQRFYESQEFKEVLKLVKLYNPLTTKVLDIPAGNGIATYAFAKAGYEVTAVEPDNSELLGRRAIEFVFKSTNLNCEIVNSYGEELPFNDDLFDVIYVRQGLHHAYNLELMLKEYSRVLKKGGILIACREHVVDNKKGSLQAFLDKQVDHQLYGGENAFLLSEYLNAIRNAGLSIITKFGPYSSPINLHPFIIEDIENRILQSKYSKILLKIFPSKLILKITFFVLKVFPRPGRLYSFVAKK
jgi:ubiquinone/menaquinone biosynthesis C-methylase UbiE